MRRGTADTLFICFTPLHALIAGKIIEREGIADYSLIYYYSVDNTKVRSYYESLARNAKHAVYFHKTNRITDFTGLLTVIFKMRRETGRSATVYSGNIKTLYSRWVIALLRIPHIRSFDDGFGAVNPKGYFSRDLGENLLTRADRFFGINISYHNVYQRIERHYTIYRLPNVMPNTEHLQIFDPPAVSAQTTEKEVTVLLSSTLSEEYVLPRDKEQKLFSTVIRELGVRYVIPHPLERFNKYEGDDVEVIASDKIAEEIIFDLRRRFQNVRVVGWFSSALLNLAGIDGIEPVTISFNDALLENGVRELFESSGIRIYKPAGFAA